MIDLIDAAKKGESEVAHRLMDYNYQKVQGIETTAGYCKKLLSHPIADTEKWIVEAGYDGGYIVPYSFNESTMVLSAYEITYTDNGFRFTGEIMDLFREKKKWWIGN
jgi:hypothetical protein